MSNEPAEAIAEPATKTQIYSSARQWLAVGSVGLGAFAFVTTEFLPVGLLPYVAKDLGIRSGTAGLMVTIPGILAAIFAVVLTMGAGMMDRRHVLLYLSGTLLASNLLSAVAPNFLILLFCRAMLGAALGGFWTLAIVAASRLVQPKDAAKAIALILAGVTCATVIGAPLGTFMSGFGTWRASFLVTSGIAGIALFGQFVLLPALPSAQSLRLAALTRLLKQPFLRKSMVMVAFGFGAHFCSYTYISPFLLRSAGFSPSSLTLILLAFGVIGFVTNFVSARFVDTHLRTTTTTVFITLAVALLSISGLQHMPVGLVFLLMLWGICFGAMPLCLSVWMQRATPEAPEAGSAIFISIIQIGIAVGSWAGGRVADNFGISAVFVAGGILAAVGLVTITTFRRDSRHTGTPQPVATSTSTAR